VSIEMIKWFLSLLLLICCITFNDLCMLKHLANVRWSWLVHGVWYWSQFAIILWKVFASMLIKRLAYNSLFSCCVLVRFWDNYNISFIEWVWQCSFTF
jgi:hypothetical protein